MAKIAIISIIVGIFAVFDCISFALSLALDFNDQLQYNDGGISIALMCSAAFVGASFFTLLFVSLPACLCHCSQDDTAGCCTPTYFVSVAVAGSFTVIGTFVAGILQTFTIYNYEGAAAFPTLHAAAAFNLISATFGVITMVASLSVCLCNEENWYFCKKRPHCVSGKVIALIFIAVLLIAVFIAALLTLFTSFSVYQFSSKHGDSPNSSRADIAAYFSYITAVCVLFGFCIGGPVVCCSSPIKLKNLITTLSCIMCVWALLGTGTVVSGGLMIKVGQSFSSEETLDPDQPLNRASISAMGYFIGALNLSVSVIACSLCCIGVVCCNSRKQDIGDNYSLIEAS